MHTHKQQKGNVHLDVLSDQCEIKWLVWSMISNNLSSILLYTVNNLGLILELVYQLHTPHHMILYHYIFTLSDK